MGIIRRVSDVMSANLNDVVDRFEDPERMLRHAVREMEASVSAATTAAARAVSHHKLLTRQRDQHAREAATWHERARQALARDDEAGARQAIVHKTKHARLAETLAEQADAVEANNRRLLDQLAAMNERLADARRRLVMLTARKRAADARRHIVSGSSLLNQHAAALQRFEQMAEKLEASDFEAEALYELQLSFRDELAHDLETTADEAEIEAELAALKRSQVGTDPAPGDDA